MNPVKNFKNRQMIQHEAAAWVVKIDSDDLSESERSELAIWLQESPSHKKEFIELARVWGNLDVLQFVAEVTPTAPEPYEQISANLFSTREQSPASRSLESEGHASEVQTGKAALMPQSKRHVYTAVAASFALFSLLFLLKVLPYGDAQLRSVERESFYITAIGEQRDINLPDGSHIKLNTSSSVKVNFSATQRAIYLEQGEANFIVAKDKNRPFIVYVGQGSVTAVGTVFNVKLNRGVTDVLVTEGVVKVNPSVEESPSSKSVKDFSVDAVASVVAGQKARFNASKITDLQVIKTADINQELAWHSGMLSFSDTPLREVIDEVSRYTSTQIVIDDKDVANLQVAGYFKAGETEAMLEVLQLSFGVKVTHLPNNKVLLSKSDRFVDH